MLYNIKGKSTKKIKIFKTFQLPIRVIPIAIPAYASATTYINVSHLLKKLPKINTPFSNP